MKNIFRKVVRDSRRRAISERGDTIIEVMLTTTVLALVLAVSFVSANHSLQTGTQAAERSQALQYAQTQVELLRAAANAGTITNFPTDGTPFCIDPATGDKTNPDSSGLCYLDNQSQYGVVVTYSSSNLTYTVNAQWPGATTTAQLALYYQVPLFAFSQGGGSVNPPSNGPDIEFTASPTSVISGGSSTLNWSVTGASGCTASNGWSGSKGVSGSASTGALTTDTTYTLTCDSDSGGPSAFESVTVSITSGISVALKASPDSVQYYQSSTLSWQVSGAISCSASSNADWSGPIAPTDGSAVIDHLSSGTKFFSLTCKNAAGQKAASATVNVNNNPGFCLDVNYGGGCTYFGSSQNSLGSLNDEVSSVLVPPGRRLILHKDANNTGACQLATSNIANMGSTNVGNDALSSFKIGTGSQGC